MASILLVGVTLQSFGPYGIRPPWSASARGGGREKITLSNLGPHGSPDGVQSNAQGRPKPWLRFNNQARAKNHGISNGVRWSR